MRSNFALSQEGPGYSNAVQVLEMCYLVHPGHCDILLHCEIIEDLQPLLEKKGKLLQKGRTLRSRSMLRHLYSTSMLVWIPMTPSSFRYIGWPLIQLLMSGICIIWCSPTHWSDGMFCREIRMLNCLLERMSMVWRCHWVNSFSEVLQRIGQLTWFFYSLRFNRLLLLKEWNLRHSVIRIVKHSRFVDESEYRVLQWLLTDQGTCSSIECELRLFHPHDRWEP